MIGIFIANFTLTLAVDISKIFVKFDTHQKNRILKALQWVHLLSIVDLALITIFRYSHSGKVCFCEYEINDPSKLANCRDTADVLLDFFIYLLWSILAIVIILAITYRCIPICFKNKREKGETS